jgi:hypothetical protein
MNTPSGFGRMNNVGARGCRALRRLISLVNILIADVFVILLFLFLLSLLCVLCSVLSAIGRHRRRGMRWVGCVECLGRVCRLVCGVKRSRQGLIHLLLHPPEREQGKQPDRITSRNREVPISSVLRLATNTVRILMSTRLHKSGQQAAATLHAQNAGLGGSIYQNIRCAVCCLIG